MITAIILLFLLAWVIGVVWDSIIFQRLIFASTISKTPEINKLTGTVERYFGYEVHRSNMIEEGKIVFVIEDRTLVAFISPDQEISELVVQ